MNPVVGWILAAACVAVGYVQYGWQGALAALSMIVFWLLLQFTRAVHVLRQAAGSPKGTVPSAVMLHARLKPGMLLMDILKLTRSLGDKLGDDPETYEWRDAGGDTLRAQLRDGKLTQWELKRGA